MFEDDTATPSGPEAEETGGLSEESTQDQTTLTEDTSVESVDIPDDPEERERGFLREDDYIRKTQKVAEERKQLEEDRKQLDSYKQRAEAFDRLTSDPNYRNAFLVALGDQGSHAPQQQSHPEDPPVSLEDFEEGHVKAVDYIAKQAVERLVGSKLAQIEREHNELRKQRVVQEWNNLATEFPNAKDFQADVVSMLQSNPSLTLRQALFAAGGPSLQRKAADPKPTGQKPLIPSGQRQAAQVPRPDAASTSAASGAKKSLAEIVKEIGTEQGLY